MYLNDPAAKRRVYRRIARRDGPGCAYCGSELTDPPARSEGTRLAPTLRTLDHLTPRSRGGSNRVGNLVLACFRCNVAKRDLLPLEFVASRARPTTTP